MNESLTSWDHCCLINHLSLSMHDMRSFSVMHLSNSGVNKRAMAGRGYVMFDMLTDSAF